MGARAFCKTGTELCDMVGDSKSLCVSITRAKTLVMPFEALTSKGRIRFTRCARRRITTELATVGMIIKNVIGRADLTTRRLAESHRENCPSIEPSIDIRACNRFKPLDSFWVAGNSILLDLGISRLQVLSIHDSRDLKSWILDIVGGEGLVERIVANNIGVACKSCVGGVPERDKFIVHVELIVEQCSKTGHTLLGVVIVSEHDLEAVFDEIVSIFVHAVIQVVHVVAHSNTLVEILEKDVDKRVDAGWIFTNDLLRIEIRDALAAHIASIHILMCIDKRVNACFAHFIDKSLNLVKIISVIFASFLLDTFPHYT